MTTLMKLQGILRICEKYANEKDVSIPGAEHDIIYLPLPAEGIAQSDLADLDKLGAFVDSQTDCWAVFA